MSPSPDAQQNLGHDVEHDAQQQIVQRVCVAAAGRTPLRIVGSGSKSFLAAGAGEGEVLDMSVHCGVIEYEPSELIVTARAGTPITEVEDLLARESQHLAFEPPRLRWGRRVPAGPGMNGAGANGAGTWGGMIAAGLGGPARFAAGSVRDHVLGLTLVNGRGELLRLGGKVMKNVAGFDLARVVTGAMGTLGVILDATLKVAPRPMSHLSLRFELHEAEALAQLNAWAAQPLPMDANAWWDDQLIVRLQGLPAAVQAAAQRLGGEPLEHRDSLAFWQGLRDQADEFFLRARQAVDASPQVTLWRLSLPATTPAFSMPGEHLNEWCGGLRWWCTSMPAGQVRELAREKGGHATPYYTRDPQGPALSELTPLLARWNREVKRAFDPDHLFNRARLFSDL